MKPHGTLSRPRNLNSAALPVAALLIFVALSVLGIASGTAQSTQDAAAAPAQDEREFKNTIPGHVPIKVKIKNEKSFKDKGNKNWFRELEVEVKNTGDKPIYYVYVLLTLPELVRGGIPLGYQFTYGRRELWLIDTEVTPEDVPILPGETVTLKLSEALVKGYEHGRELEKRDDPQRVELDLQAVVFGDGTGLYYMNGSPKRRKPKKLSANDPLKRPTVSGDATNFS